MPFISSMSSELKKAVVDNAREHGPFLDKEAAFSEETIAESREITADAFLMFINQCYEAVGADLTRLSLVTALLDLSLQRAGGKERETYTADSWAFCLHLQASFLCMVLADSCRLIEYLEHRQKRIAEVADGANGIILLRVVRGLLNRLNPVLRPVERGRVLRFLALCKGFGHPSRLNKRGKVYTDEKAEIERYSADFSPAYYVAMMADLPSTCDAARVDKLALQPLISELQQQFLRLKPDNEMQYLPVRDWLLLTWETISATELLVLSLQVYMTFRNWGDGFKPLIIKSKEIIDVLKPEYISLIERTETDWKRWKDAQCPKFIKPESSEPISEDYSVKNMPSLPDLTTFQNNSRLTALLTTDISLPQVLDTIKKAVPGNSTSQSSSQLRTQNWKAGILYHSQKKQPEPKELEDLAKLDDPSFGPSLCSPKRARVSYEELPRVQSNSIKPLPY